MRPIAISGKAGAGKSALAELLVEALYPDARRVSFADAIKKKVWDTYRLQKSDPGGREKLIEVGETLRDANPDHWIHQLAFTIDHVWPPDSYIPVIDDLRFRRELEWCRERGFYVVRVDAPTTERLGRLISGGHDVEVVYSRHPGETELDGADFDFRFSNGSLDGCTLDCVAEKVIRRARGLVA